MCSIQETFDGPWLNLGVDVGHHDGYSMPLGVLPDAARRLRGLPALLVGLAGAGAPAGNL